MPETTFYTRACSNCKWWELLEEDPAIGAYGACHHPLPEAQYIAFTGETAPGGLAVEGARRACRLFELRTEVKNELG